MSRQASPPKKGDVYWIDPNPVSGREMQDRHRFVIVTPKKINALGVSMAVPITNGGAFARNMGLTVPICGYNTTGVVVCNQIRSFDILARVQAGTARYVETFGEELVSEIVNRVLSVIEPAV